MSHDSVAQPSGHKNLKRLDSYAVASQEQQRRMSKILSGEDNTKPNASKKSKKKQTNKQIGDATVKDSIQVQGTFSGASIGIIKIQNLVLPGTSGSKQASEIHATPKKSLHHIIESQMRRTSSIFL